MPLKQATMPEVSNLFAMQILLLTLILVGLLCVKIKIIDGHTRSALSELILNVFLPCNILSSFLGKDASKLPSLLLILALSAGLLILCFFLSKLFYGRFGAEQKKVLLYATIISNATFLGNPVIESIYGFDALIYSAAYLLPLRVTVWSLGLAIFSGAKGNIRSIVFHPCLVATYLGFAVMFTGFHVPEIFSRIIFSLGNCTTPLSMMLVGSVLGLIEPKKIVTGVVFYYSAIRLILIPLFMLGIMFLIKPEPIVAGVTVILSGTPAPVTTSILAGKYKSDNELASRIIFVSTLLSIVTIPALSGLLQRLM